MIIPFSVDLDDSELMEIQIEMYESGGGGSGGKDPYTGSYTIIPKVTDQTMPTYDKYMENDVTIKKIPLHEVSNVDGTTLIIGGLV